MWREERGRQVAAGEGGDGIGGGEGDYGQGESWSKYWDRVAET